MPTPDGPIAALRRLVARMVNALRPGRAERDLAREIASHLTMLEDDGRRRGMSVEEARRAARRSLGGVEQAKELHRDERSFRWIEDARRDARHAVRALVRDRVVAATVILSLAIGIGASAAIFSAAEALLLRRPAGIAGADRLVDIGVARDDGGINPASFPAFLDLHHRSSSFAGVYARQMFPIALGLRSASGASNPERVFGQFVSSNYFQVLGVHAAAGTWFPAGGGDTPGSSPYVVLSHACWSSRFGGDPAVIGRPLVVNGRPLTIVGIAPGGFHGTAFTAPELWLPLNMLPATTGEPEAVFTSAERGWLMIGARLKPEVSLAAAGQEVGARVSAGAPGGAPAARPLRALPSAAVPGNRATIAAFLTVLMGMVLLVVLVACGNVSGVLLARASARRREIAMRLALGASRARLVRQLLVETAVLFLLAAAGGLALARAGSLILTERLPALPFPVALSLRFDAPVIAFAVCLSLLAGLASGLAPALRAAREQPVAALKDVHGVGRSRLRQLFVVAQVALSVALVVAAGLFARALAHAGAVDPGFDPEGIELASLDISTAGYTSATGPAFWRSLVERIRALPGVEQATVARVVPGGFEGIGLGLGVPGAAPIADGFEADGNIVEPGYFATLGIPLRAGRDFSAADRAGAERVAIVGEAAARRFWPGEEALGKYLSQGTPEGTRYYAVVGVVGDIASTTLVDGVSKTFVYLPLQQAYAPDLTSSMALVIRTREGASIAPAVTQVVASLDPALAAPTFQALADSIALGLTPQRIAVSLASGLGAVGLLLAGIGIYGVTAFTATRRLREFAIRRALGARRTDIVFIVLRQGLGLTVAGCAVGLVVAAAAASVLSAFLLGVPAIDPVAFAGAVALFAGAGAAACYGPARRAIGIDPAAALRAE